MKEDKQKAVPDVSVIIPVYNEAECIVENMRKIREVLEKGRLHYELIVVDDGSTDNSRELVRNTLSNLKNVCIANHKKNMGTSETIRTGLRTAEGIYVTHLDADLQYSPEDVIRFYQHAKQSQAPFIWGKSDKSIYSAFRLFLAKSKNIFAGILFGIPVTVDLSSIKLIKRSAISNFQFSKRKQVIGLELFLHAIKNNHKIIPVPVKVITRTKGKSSFSVRWIFETVQNTIVLYLNRKSH